MGKTGEITLEYRVFDQRLRIPLEKDHPFRFKKITHSDSK